MRLRAVEPTVPPLVPATPSANQGETTCDDDVDAFVHRCAPVLSSIFAIQPLFQHSALSIQQYLSPTSVLITPVTPDRQAQTDERESGERGDMAPGGRAGARADGAESELTKMKAGRNGAMAFTAGGRTSKGIQRPERNDIGR